MTQGGLRAICDLEQLERERGNKEYLDAETAKNGVQNHTIRARTASNEMCTFLVMNISSLQLIPVNIIAYRSQYGSANPAAVIAPARKSYCSQYGSANPTAATMPVIVANFLCGGVL